MSKTLLIDGDIMVHTTCLRVTRDVEWDAGIRSSYVDDRELMQQLDLRVAEARDKFAPGGEVLIALSDYPADGLRWREELMPIYKGQRHERKPLGFFKARDYLAENYKAYCQHKLEGDDLLGIWATGKFAGPDTVVLSIDKDLQTIPCNLARGMDKPVVTISQQEADHYHLIQTLMGDRVDNYPGCKGVGEKSAWKLLGKPGEKKYDFTLRTKWRHVVEAFRKADQTKEGALLTARVARILRADEYDHRNKKVRLWNPPK